MQRKSMLTLLNPVKFAVWPASRDHPAVSSMAALQGLLMSHREDPRGAVKAAARILQDATETVVA